MRSRCARRRMPRNRSQIKGEGSMKSSFWKKDWFLGLVVSVAIVLLGTSQVIQSLERSAYDWGVRASSQNPSDKVVVIAIDDASIRNIGRWPWSRDVHA